MKKMIFKALFMLLVVTGLSNYLIYLNTGQAPFTIDSFKLDNISAPDLGNLAPQGDDTAYKWVDENGVTQYSSEPPPEHIRAQTLTIDPNTNLVAGTKPKEEKKDPPKTPSGAALPTGNIYKPETINKLMDDAKNVQTLLEDRKAQQDKVLDGL